MQKPKAGGKEWHKDLHEAREALTCQSLILEFLHFKEEYGGEVVPATQKTVQEFWNYLENKKEELMKRGQKFAEKYEPDKERIESEVKYDRTYVHIKKKPKIK